MTLCGARQLRCRPARATGAVARRGAWWGGTTVLEGKVGGARQQQLKSRREQSICRFISTRSIGQ